MQNPQVKYLIFDIDGTLTDTTGVDDKCYIKAFLLAFEEDISNVNWSNITNLTDWGIAEELVKSRLNRDLTNEDLQKIKAIHIDLLSKELNEDASQFKEIPGSRKFYDHVLNQEQFKVGIATGAWEESAITKLNAIGIDPIRVCFSNSNHHVSREAITTDVINQLKAKSENLPDEIIYFGDGTWDYNTCKNLGIKFIGIDHKSDGKLKELGAKSVLNNFKNPIHILNLL